MERSLSLGFFRSQKNSKKPIVLVTFIECSVSDLYSIGCHAFANFIRLFCITLMILTKLSVEIHFTRFINVPIFISAVRGRNLYKCAKEEFLL